MLKRLCIVLSLLVFSSCSTFFSPFMKFHPQESQDFGGKRLPVENNMAQQEAQAMGKKARHGKRTPLKNTTTPYSTGSGGGGSNLQTVPPGSKQMGNNSNVNKPRFQWLRENGRNKSGVANSYVIGSPYSSTSNSKNVTLRQAKQYLPVPGNADKSVVRQDIYGINQVSREIQPQYLKPAAVNYFDKGQPL